VKKKAKPGGSGDRLAGYGGKWRGRNKRHAVSLDQIDKRKGARKFTGQPGGSNQRGW